ncbi:MAG: PEP-CTERM sorting domain-containing protein [Candidatus Eisenbacteria sp.]|nr:PEP-CTERM sorting domain-containing protein [Candidatus Eisenbacteria bacterium]
MSSILRLLVYMVAFASPFCVCIGQSSAGVITVVNPSFEDYFLENGAWTHNGVGLTGWTVSGSGSVGLFNPLESHFPLGIPDGENTAYSHGLIISQVLSAVLTANNEYVLTVGIGDAGNATFGGYAVQLLAGGTLLAEDDNTLTPLDGGFVESTVSYTALPDNPDLGNALEIKLLALGPETNFDLVQLSQVPEPSTWVLLGIAAVGLFRYHLRQKRAERG